MGVPGLGPHDRVRPQLGAQPLECGVGGAEIAPRRAEQIALLAGEGSGGDDHHAHGEHRRGERPAVEQRAAPLEQGEHAGEGTGWPRLARDGVRGALAQRAPAVVEGEGDGDSRRGAPLRYQLAHQPVECRAHEKEHRLHGFGGRRELDVHRGVCLDAGEHGAARIVGASQAPGAQAELAPAALDVLGAECGEHAHRAQAEGGERGAHLVVHGDEGERGGGEIGGVAPRGDDMHECALAGLLLETRSRPGRSARRHAGTGESHARPRVPPPRDAQQRARQLALAAHGVEARRAHPPEPGGAGHG